MTDPTQPNEPVPPQDPTRQMPTAPPPTETVTTTTRAPGPAPSGGGVSGGAVAAIALGVAAVALLIGFLVWGQDDDDPDVVAPETPTSAGEDTAPGESVPDQSQEVADLQAQVDDLQSQLDDVTAERDELRSQLDDSTVTTTELADVVGSSIDEVRDLAADNGWELVEQEPEDPGDDVETDTVLSQTPGPGTAMIEGSALLVEVVPG